MGAPEQGSAVGFVGSALEVKMNVLRSVRSCKSLGTIETGSKQRATMLFGNCILFNAGYNNYHILPLFF